MEVILKEDVPKLGARGEVVRVTEGYGRNYLLPRKLAIEATPANRAVVEQMKAAAVRRSAREKGDSEALARQFEGVKLTFHRRAGEHEQLFGSVTSADVAHELEKRGLTVDRRKIHLTDPLKNLGEYTVPIRLHREVTATVQVTVAKEAEEDPAGESNEE